MKPLVYIASPYSVGDKLKNTQASLFVASRLRDDGACVPVAPLLTHYWDQLYPADYDVWLDIDKEWLARCDAVLRLPGVSNVADAEVDYAVSLGIPVFHSVEALYLNLR